MQVLKAAAVVRKKKEREKRERDEWWSSFKIRREVKYDGVCEWLCVRVCVAKENGQVGRVDECPIEQGIKEESSWEGERMLTCDWADYL